LPYWRLFYHIVWATRNRESLITSGLEAVVWAAVRQAAERHGGRVHAVGGVADHVHLLVSIPPSIPVATAVGRIKGASARWVNQQHPGDPVFGWQAEYGVVSVSEENVTAIARYVEEQAAHHADQRLWPALELDGPPSPQRGGR